MAVLNINRMASVEVFVSDMKRAIEFYQNTLGIGVRARSPETPNWVELDTEGTTLALYSPPEEWPEAKGFGRFTGINLETQDIEGVYRSLSSKGVRFSGPPTKQYWGGIETNFFDPDGNQITLLMLPQGP